ncbi:hypothetical protein LFM09_02805 [Lentzea alba]|uniref:hypothetical protein n=1 Tax=Lentzea alba TaxID=2714351 RepID=UPI0039BF98D4
MLGKVVKSPWFLLVGGIAAVLSLIAALTGPVPELFKQRTKATSLVAESNNKPHIASYALPLDAPLEQMPYPGPGPCDGDLAEWLRRFGTMIPESHGISIRNAAEDGAMLAVDNLRALDVEISDPAPAIRFECQDQGNSELVPLELGLDRDRKAYEKTESGNRPFAFNLEPGEIGNLMVFPKASDDKVYTGRLVADVTTGKTKETVSLPVNGENSDRFEYRTFGKYGRLAVVQGTAKNLFLCRLYPTVESLGSSNYELFECTPEKIRSLVAEIGRS